MDMYSNQQNRTWNQIGQVESSTYLTFDKVNNKARLYVCAIASKFAGVFPADVA